MTPEQEKHLNEIIKAIHTGVETKYRRGQAEHGGNLWEVSAEKLVDEMINEAIDQLVYGLTLKNVLAGVPIEASSDRAPTVQ